MPRAERGGGVVDEVLPVSPGYVVCAVRTPEAEVVGYSGRSVEPNATRANQRLRAVVGGDVVFMRTGFVAWQLFVFVVFAADGEVFLDVGIVVFELG